jgi:hypothetical protein
MKDKEGKDDKDNKDGVGLIGTVTAVNGTTLTIVGIQGRGNGMAITTYTVDAGSAVVFSGSHATSTLSSIEMGDKVFVNGTTTGTTTVGARFILDGIGNFFKKMGHGFRGIFSWGAKDN